MKLSLVIFGPMEQLSHSLEGKDTTVEEARNAALVTEAFLGKQRTDDVFNRFYEAVLTALKDLTDELVLLRRCKLPQRFDTGDLLFSHPHPKIFIN